ncbi:hypothetical protein [uncultured Jannaschia sp.]|uniref:hypothetical protein n=1 Tax=uncultured Jannaschia sp. TaxID=293347 RepID=UPI00262CF4B7|nr:hypothetical protein [uncultured Jannaschia sp.]
MADKLEFPKFSNDGEYLRVVQKDDILTNLGGRDDDHLNFFTTRMLLLLESRCVHGEHVYLRIVEDVIASYFRDYPDHKQEFSPTFLINDILRFWKTLCLNYEHRRNQPNDGSTKRIKQKTKNFKLKFSRMLTCFGSVALIVANRNCFRKPDLVSMCKNTPRQRLETACEGRLSTQGNLSAAFDLYDWFLEETDVPESDLMDKFQSTDYKRVAFSKADEFGDHIFSIISDIAGETDYMRYLVI